MIPLRPTSLALLTMACAKSTAPAPAPEAEAPATPVETYDAVEAPDFTTIDGVLAAPHRDGDRARDAYRHPAGTLDFCGLEPDHTVIELTPGSGWYTRILAPYLATSGTYVGAPPSADGRRAKYRTRFTDLLASDPDLYGRAATVTFDPPGIIDLGETGSADLVLTFRNTHNWIGDDGEQAAYAAAFEVLKPGGVLCVVQHRAPADDAVDPKERAETGYVRQAYVVTVAEAAGFTLDATSELNANPQDTTDHPKGVWTLPPGFALGDEDRERYAAIGESDRMTLRFVKP